MFLALIASFQESVGLLVQVCSRCGPGKYLTLVDATARYEHVKCPKERRRL